MHQQSYVLVCHLRPCHPELLRLLQREPEVHLGDARLLGVPLAACLENVLFTLFRVVELFSEAEDEGLAFLALGVGEDSAKMGLEGTDAKGLGGEAEELEEV